MAGAPWPLLPLSSIGEIVLSDLEVFVTADDAMVAVRRALAALGAQPAVKLELLLYAGAFAAEEDEVAVQEAVNGMEMA